MRICVLLNADSDGRDSRAVRGAIVRQLPVPGLGIGGRLGDHKHFNDCDPRVGALHAAPTRTRTGAPCDPQIPSGLSVSLLNSITLAAPRDGQYCLPAPVAPPNRSTPHRTSQLKSSPSFVCAVRSRVRETVARMGPRSGRGSGLRAPAVPREDAAPRAEQRRAPLARRAVPRPAPMRRLESPRSPAQATPIGCKRGEQLVSENSISKLTVIL